MAYRMGGWATEEVCALLCLKNAVVRVHRFVGTNSHHRGITIVAAVIEHGAWLLIAV